MAGHVPFFLTGANAKILLNNETVAFATDLTYRISVKHASPRVLGRFEVEVHQPLSYDVTGSFTIIRYSRGLDGYLGGAAPKDAMDPGSGIGSYDDDAVGGALGLPTANGQFDGKPSEAFNPSRMFQSKMFDIEIRQKVPGNAVLQGIKVQGPPMQDPNGLTPPAGTSVGKALNTVAKGLNGFLSSSLNNETTVIKIRDCRIEESEFRISKRLVATQTFTFKARYVDELS
jgi:hypothetical protein